MTGGVGGVRGVLGADRDSRFSGARRGIKASRGFGLLGVQGPIWGVRGVLGLEGILGNQVRRGMMALRLQGV